MIRQSFRIGVKVGLLAAAIAIVAKIVQGRQPQPVVPARAPAPPQKAWPPLETTVEASVPAAQAPAAEPAPTAKKTTTKSATKPAVSWVEPDGNVCPTTHPVKGKLASKIFHVEGGLSYERTNPDRCYADPAAAEADGFRAAKR